MYKQVIGHSEQIRRLQLSREKSILANGYIFTGPEGIGKKQVAIEFVKSFYCKTDPCDQCAECMRISSLRHEALMYIEPEETSIPIAKAREIARFLSLRSNTYRFVLIDDAHVLTEEAQNSMLKVLEEPPANSSIILITHLNGMLLETVRSRCQVIHFAALGKDQVQRFVAAKSESQIPRSGLDLVCLLAEGSLRRAQEFMSRYKELEPEVNLILEKIEKKDFNYLVDSYAKGKSAAESREKARFLFKLIMLRLRRNMDKSDTSAIEAVFDGFKALDQNANVSLVVEETLIRSQA